MDILNTAQSHGENQFLDFQPHRLPLTGASDDRSEFVSYEFDAGTLGVAEELGAEEIDALAA